MTRRARLEAGAFPPLGEVLELLRLVWQVDHELHRTSRQMEQTLGVTAPQRLVLRIVGRFPGVPAGRLAQLLHVHPGTLSGILARLEQRGLLQRWTDARDRRRALLGLSHRGRKLDAASAGTVEAAVAEAIAGVSEESLAAARELLDAVAGALVRVNERATSAAIDVRASPSQPLRSASRRGSRPSPKPRTARQRTRASR